jgi:hypothetical protein
MLLHYTEYSYGVYDGLVWCVANDIHASRFSFTNLVIKTKSKFKLLDEILKYNLYYFLIYFSRIKVI